MQELYKYSGAGNDFIVLDGRVGDMSEYRQTERITKLCSRDDGFFAADGRMGADGLMILSGSDEYDFHMEFYNPDGSGGMMCGNGGRCIVAFAHFLGIVPADGKVYTFDAADGLHTGEILESSCGSDIVRLRMKNVYEFRQVLGGWFLDTGTRHFVKFVDDVEDVNINKTGRAYRWDPEFAPVGANANFVSVEKDGTLRVRTFEKGVEAETLACGTGITASAIASYLKGIKSPYQKGDSIKFDVEARQDRLAVEFRRDGARFTDVYLTGPAERIY